MKKIAMKLLLAGLFGTLNISAGAATTDFGNITLPFSTAYSNTFSSQAGQFVDDFVFTISPGGSFNTIAATIDLGSLFSIEGLEARLFQGTGPFIPGTTPLEQAWSTPVNAAPGSSGQILVINPITLAANTYSLEIRGNVIGTSGGSYSGALNIATLPVPEPGTYALMLAGLGLIGGIAAKRRKAV